MKKTISECFLLKFLFEKFQFKQNVLRFFIRKDVIKYNLLDILNVTVRKGISEFHHTTLQSFTITTGISLSHVEKILISESRAHQNSNWQKFKEIVWVIQLN